MDIIELAQSSGMQIVLDGRIGREEYRSVFGSIQAPQCFANALISFCMTEVWRSPDMVSATGDQAASACL